MRDLEELRCTYKKCRKAKKELLALIRGTGDVRVLKGLLYHVLNTSCKCRFCSTMNSPPEEES